MWDAPCEQPILLRQQQQLQQQQLMQQHQILQQQLLLLQAQQQLAWVAPTQVGGGVGVGVPRASLSPSLSPASLPRGAGGL